MPHSRLKYQRYWRKNNPGRSAAYTKKWRDANKQKCRQLACERAKRDLAAVKKELIAAYGGKCSCCGEKHHEFLSLDHKRKGDGKRHRAKFKTSFKIYKHLKKLGFPTKVYRLLCFNCNMSHGIWGTARIPDPRGN